jgi:hypothetical protein
VAQTPHLLFGQFLHTSLPWLEERNAPDAMVIYSEKGADRYGNPSCYLLDIHELLRSHEGWNRKRPGEEEAHGRANYSDVLPM